MDEWGTWTMYGEAAWGEMYARSAWSLLVSVVAAILIRGSRAAAISPRRGRSATGTAPVPPEEDPTARHTADAVKRTSTGVPGRRSRACPSRHNHSHSPRR